MSNSSLLKSKTPHRICGRTREYTGGSSQSGMSYPLQIQFSIFPNHLSSSFQLCVTAGLSWVSSPHETLPAGPRNDSRRSNSTTFPTSPAVNQHETVPSHQRISAAIEFGHLVQHARLGCILSLPLTFISLIRPVSLPSLPLPPILLSASRLCNCTVSTPTLPLNPC